YGGQLRHTAELPESLAGPLTVTTGPDGQARLHYLAAADQLVAVRVAAGPIGAQDILLLERPWQSPVEPVITIRLKKTSRLAGRILDGAGHPVVHHVVEVWSRGGGSRLMPNLVGFQDGPLRTAADGRFQTPDNLLVGSTYRIVVRDPGQEPILSDWITIGESPRTLLPMRLRPLRTITGRVVDRQGQPVANVTVFQTGDGPEATATRTGPDGRFALGGFRQGPVFVFARAEAFRFQGQLVPAGQAEATVELTRSSEPPARVMRMLPELIPLEESRAMARRLVEPYWRVVVEKGDDLTKFSTLQALLPADPAGVLEKLEAAKFLDKRRQFELQAEVVAALAASDPEEAAAVAESIPDPAPRADALLKLIDALPDADRARKLALLDRAALQARSVPDVNERLRVMGDVAERWHELGQVEKAKALFAEGLRIASQMTDKTDYRRGDFAAQLALVDVPAALAIAKDFEGNPSRGTPRGEIALRSIDQDPAEAERLWKGLRGGRSGLLETLCWKMARVDPARARRLIESFRARELQPHLYLFLALGEKPRDEPAARQAFEEGLREIDRLMHERPERFQSLAGWLLPIVERIDPALVPEMFWRDVASRPPSGNPRTIRASSPADLIRRLVWYDREVAAALFEPIRARMEHTEDQELATWGIEFAAWSLFDPRAAVARLEKVPVSNDPGRDANRARLAAATVLGLPYEAGWRRLWNPWSIILGGSQHRF
ncbi:MAG TPA: carboxypeptidase-like regulatory domain-containing protein, partial [Isosphaeraceae bacterium]|nr:carboxypeptidase-like regulatory domain-containing protein [Isosphaeraceae bacterium]